MMKWTKYFLLFISMAILPCCGSSTKPSPVGLGQIPTWVAKPQVEHGIVATECTPATQEYTLDRKKIVTRAREKLASQLRAKVVAMEKTCRENAELEDDSIHRFSFRKAFKQLINKTVEQTDPDKIRYEKFDNNKQLCVRLSLNQSQMKDLFNRLVDQCEADLAPEEKRILFQNFKAKQVEKQLE